MPIGDPYRLTLEGTIFGQQVRNVFHYAVTADPSNLSSSAQLNGVFETDVAPAIKDLVSEEYSANFLNTYCETRDTDFSILESFGAGSALGDCMPSFVAYGFQLVRGSRTGRHGRKAFAGVIETAVLDGEVVDPAVIAQLHTLAAAMLAPLVVGSVTYRPIIWVNDTGSSETVAWTEVSSVLFKRITTQNQRKIGRGI